MLHQLNKCNVVMIDNFDSFTFNLVETFERFGCKTEVWRNDISIEIALSRLRNLGVPTMLVISPGPGTPSAAGNCVELIRRAAGYVPIAGVCLGHQAIIEAFGGTVGNATQIVHGKSSQMEHSESSIFSGVSSPMTVGRYHSLVAHQLPNCLEKTGHVGGMTMAVSHRFLPIHGFQFHPESILTPQGDRLIHNLVDWAREWSANHNGQHSEVC
jgi:anthranilate synthase component II